MITQKDIKVYRNIEKIKRQLAILDTRMDFLNTDPKLKYTVNGVVEIYSNRVISKYNTLCDKFNALQDEYHTIWESMSNEQKEGYDRYLNIKGYRKAILFSLVAPLVWILFWVLLSVFVLPHDIQNLTAGGIMVFLGVVFLIKNYYRYKRNAKEVFFGI